MPHTRVIFYVSILQARAHTEWPNVLLSMFGIVAPSVFSTAGFESLKHNEVTSFKKQGFVMYFTAN